jgi:hypothetical protein
LKEFSTLKVDLTSINFTPNRRTGQRELQDEGQINKQNTITETNSTGTSSIVVKEALKDNTIIVEDEEELDSSREHIDSSKENEEKNVEDEEEEQNKDSDIMKNLVKDGNNNNEGRDNISTSRSFDRSSVESHLVQENKEEIITQGSSQ